MLGIRLDTETERGLEALARRSGQPKSQIAREAIRQYLAKSDLRVRAREEWLMISRRESEDAELDTVLGEAMQELDGRD
jgi:predicted transcriptional regulator